MNPALLGIVSAISWGCLDLVATVSSRRIGSVLTVVGVSVGGFLMLTAWLLLSGQGLPALAGQGALPAYGAGIGVVLASLFLFAAFAAGPIAVVSPIASSYPLTALLLAWATGDQPTTIAIAAALVVVAGVVVVATSEPTGETRNASLTRCILLAALAHLTWAVTIYAGQYATQGQTEAVHHAAVSTAWLGRLGGFAVLLPLLIVARPRASVGPVWMPVFLLLGLLDVVGIVFVNVAAGSDHPVLATVAASCFGVVTILLGWLVLKERIPPLRWLGIAVTFAGVAALVTYGHVDAS
ncbi:MAG: DMT family transporter [Hyphomicrobiales bacterium]